MIKKPKSIYRTTLDQIDNGKIPHAGIYVIAYLGKVMYVGKAEHNVIERLRLHWYKCSQPFGIWLRNIRFDWPNVRLDILEVPDYENRYWLQQAEAALVRKFNPLFNDRLLQDDR